MAIVLKLLKPPTCFESNQMKDVMHIPWCALWCGRKDLEKEQRIGVLEGSPVHISKKVHTVDQGGGEWGSYSIVTAASTQYFQMEGFCHFLWHDLPQVVESLFI